jgi:NhaA family Na+:H+ antiporter
MADTRPTRLDPPVDPAHDHVLGNPDAQITLVEYGSYVCTYCHTAHQMIRHLRDEFGDNLRYVYRHLPLADRAEASRAAELAEYVAATTGEFWNVHDTLMQRGPVFGPGELDEVAAQFGVPPRADRDTAVQSRAAARVRADARSGVKSGARVTPTFFINGRRYEGAWDEASLREAMLRSLGHRLHAATVNFVRWAPSTGVLLLLATVAALVISNGPFGAAFLEFWEMAAGLRLGSTEFSLPIIEWVNDGLLTVFFLVVGLEIKRELTVGRLASREAAMLPLAAAVGGMITPALIFFALVPPPFVHAWGMTITTDTAFAVALLVLLGDRVPVELRVFLTAAVIVDDLVAIALVALFYSGDVYLGWIAVAAALGAALFALNRSHVYRPLPYAAVGIALWFALHQSGVHATLAGVILALATPTRPPANLAALSAQAQAVIDAETRYRGESVMRSGPSVGALRALDTIHDRIESPASKLLRGVEPWSSYFVLPLFALANAGLRWSPDVLTGHERLVMAIAVALVLGKSVGIVAGAWLAVRAGIAVRPAAYGWRQVAGAGALAGIGFTMSLFIAGRSLSGADFVAAKIAVFMASLAAGTAGTAILWKRREEGAVAHVERGTPVAAESYVP